MPARSGNCVLDACMQLLRAAVQLQPAGLRTLSAAGSTWTTSLCGHQNVTMSSGDRGYFTATSSKARFYKAVHVVPNPSHSGQYQVHLDSRPVRTPGKNILSVPSYALALAIAAEWEWQASGKPQMYSMPLMSLAATALDQPKPRDKVIETLLKYVHTDTTCCRLEDGGKVAARQAQIHDPILNWAAGELGWRMSPSHDLFSPAQSDETVEAVRMYLSDLDPYHLAAIEQLTAVSKSLVIAAALRHGHITVQTALRAARVEEDCQIEEWGTVEAGHDLDEADISTRIASPSVFLRLLALVD